jgi:hypothetical protein
MQPDLSPTPRLSLVENSGVGGHTPIAALIPSTPIALCALSSEVRLVNLGRGRFGLCPCGGAGLGSNEGIDHSTGHTPL